MLQLEFQFLMWSPPFLSENLICKWMLSWNATLVIDVKNEYKSEQNTYKKASWNDFAKTNLADDKQSVFR
jgi:hypothetical protein